MFIEYLDFLLQGLAPFKEGFISALDIPVRSSPDSVKMNMPKFGKVVPHRVFVGGIDNKVPFSWLVCCLDNPFYVAVAQPGIEGFFSATLAKSLKLLNPKM